MSEERKKALGEVGNVRLVRRAALPTVTLSSRERARHHGTLELSWC